jgi:flagellar FliJ protein
MAFRFSLESVLRHRKRQEEMAHREFIEAQSILEECLKSLETMYVQIDTTRLAVSAAERSGRSKDLHMIRDAQVFIEGQKIRIHERRMKARELIRVLEDKQEQLLERLHDRKIMEKLKEKRLEEYKVKLAEMEQKELDDLTNARTAGGRR